MLAVECLCGFDRTRVPLPFITCRLEGVPTHVPHSHTAMYLTAHISNLNSTTQHVQHQHCILPTGERVELGGGALAPALQRGAEWWVFHRQ